MKIKQIGLIVLAVFVAVLIYVTISKSNRMTVEWIVLKKQQALTTIIANGRVAGSKVTQLSFLRSGVVDTIYIKERQDVQDGDTLIKLDNREEVNAVLQRKNAVKIATLNLQNLFSVDEEQARERRVQADANVVLLQEKVQRLETLFNEGSASKENVDQVRKEYEVAISEKRQSENALDKSITAQKDLLKSQLFQTRTQLNDAEINLSRTVLRAPEAGQVVKVDARKGQLVLPGTPSIFFLPADTLLHVEVQVDEGDIGTIKPGQNAVVIPVGSGKTFSARVQNIIPLVDASRGTASVNLAVLSADERFLPDLSVSAQIIIDTTEQVIVVPQIFLQNTTEEKSFVYVFRNGKAVKTEVEISNAGNGMYTIKSGVIDADTLLLAPGLKNGTTVRLKALK
ncbi:MAG: efflux RND transporter periplasmic adaptor subunit [Chitinispirillaceae bacterium]|nr:efflux RND transporter periplasmic adaptor subunit [Chitinispirillaceae bacterium]